MNKMSIKEASIIYGGAKYFTIIVQLIMSAILARILTPNDYGIVSVVSVFVTLFSILSNLGLGTAVMQYQDLSREDIQHIFTFSTYIAIMIAIVFVGCSYPIAVFYGNDVYVPIGILLAVSLLFNALNTIPNSIILREQKFLLAGLRMIICTVLSSMIGIILAILGAKYYALVFQSIIFAVLQFVWNMSNSGLRIAFKFKYAPIQRVKNYSSNQFFYNVFNYFAQNLDNLLTGKIMGNEALAYYSKSYMLMRYPVDNIAHVLTPVIHPILAAHQKEKEYIFNEFCKISKAFSLIGVFITGFCFWTSREIIVCYYGSQWYEAVSPFRWLSLCIVVQLLNALFGSIYQSLGCTKEMLQSGICHISISLISIVVGALSRDLSVLAICVSMSMFIKFFIETYFLMRKCFKFKICKYLKIFIPDVIIFSGLFVAMSFADKFSIEGLWVSLICKLFVAGITYLFLLIITKQYKYVLMIVPSRLKEKFHKKRMSF